MPTDYRGPVHGAEELEEALFQAFTGREEALYDPRPADVARIADLWAAEYPARRRNPAMARFMAGARDPRSARYRAAIRRVQRWTTRATERRRPGPRATPELTRLARRGMTLPYRRRGADVTLTAWILVSEDCRHRTIGPVHIPAGDDDLTASLDAFERDDMTTSAESFLRALADAYGLDFAFCEGGVEGIRMIAPGAPA